jgi:N5-(carboxyethyl)ornithine synthase
MRTGIFKLSFKENEKRLPIHPNDIKLIDPNVLSQLYFEEGYGLDYGYSDEQLISWNCKLVTREELYKMELIILPKPIAADLEKMQEGGILCGWTHAVQQRDITDLALEKKLTLIAWEEMFDETKSKEEKHIFYRNNELAGYAGVLHYLQLKGDDGWYGADKKVVVFGHGSVSKGAITALMGRGFYDITVYTKRPTAEVNQRKIGVVYKNINDGTIYEDLASADIIFNGVLQDVNNPLMFIKTPGELNSLKNNVGIIDISCDKGMGFYFAEPTSFENPTIDLGRGITYYSVDHTPTYLWNAATAEISKALLPYLNIIIDPKWWESSEVIRNCIDIRNGHIVNQKINKFQNR